MLPVLRVNTLSDCLLSTTPVRAFSLQAHINTTSNMPGSTSSTRRCSSSPSPASRPHLDGSCACTPSGVSTDTKGTANHTSYTHSPPFSPLPSDLGVPVSGGGRCQSTDGRACASHLFRGFINNYDHSLLSSSTLSLLPGSLPGLEHPDHSIRLRHRRLTSCCLIAGMTKALLHPSRP